MGNVDIDLLAHVALVAVMLVIVWIQKRRGKIIFRLGRVLGLGFACVVSALPFALAYAFLPGKWESNWMNVCIFLALLFTPYLTLFTVAFWMKRKREKANAKGT